MKRRSSVRLEPTKIFFPNTFIHATYRFTFTIANLTDQQIHYSIRCFSNSEDQNDSKIDLDASAGRTKLSELDKFHSKFFNVEPSHGDLLLLNQSLTFRWDQ